MSLAEHLGKECKLNLISHQPSLSAHFPTKSKRERFLAFVQFVASQKPQKSDEIKVIFLYLN